MLAAHDYVTRHFGAQLDPDQKKHLREEFAALIRRDVDKWSKIVKATGARAD